MNTIPMEELKFIKFKPDPNIISETHLGYSDNFIKEKVIHNLDNNNIPILNVTDNTDTSPYSLLIIVILTLLLLKTVRS